MLNIFTALNAIFPVREESQANRIARWLDRATYWFVLLTALAAPISIAVTNIGWLAGMFFWLLRALVKPRPRVFRTPIDIAIFAFFGWSLLSSVFSYAPDISLDRLRVLTLFPIAYLVCQNIKDTKAVRLLVGALIFSTLVTVGWTFAERALGRGVQVFGVEPAGILRKAGIQNGDTLLKINDETFTNPEQIFGALQKDSTVKIKFYRPDYYADANITTYFDQSATMRAEDLLGFEHWQTSRNWRSTGFYNHYTTYAEVLQLVASLVFGLFIASLKTAHGETEKKKESVLFKFSQPLNLRLFPSQSALLFLACLAATLAALLLTATRASQAAFLLSAFAVVALGANRKFLFSLTALSLPLAVVAAIYVQTSRNTGFVDASDNSTTWRLTIWREGAQLLAKSPRHLTFGVGIDSVKRYKCEWKLFNNCTLPAGHFHSTPLQIAVETGLPALFFWLFFVWRYGKELFLAIRRNSNDNFANGVLLGAFGGLIGFFASGLVHYNLGDSEVAMVFFLIVGLSLVLVRNGKRRET